ncbi:MAG: DUF2269 domain-containing protein [Comamonadaceae bacterium]|nr:DUF2269 domain-containing protein [Comamonadaceae bacterium]
MDTYLLVKWLHVLSSTVLFGTGVGSAYYLLTVSLSGDPQAAALVSARVVTADWLFTASTVVIQPLTGLYLVHLAGGSLSPTWISLSIWLFVLTVGCWLPVVWLQIRMRNLARQAVALEQPLPPAYRRCLMAWVALGCPAFFAMVAIFYLMVAKPA